MPIRTLVAFVAAGAALAGAGVPPAGYTGSGRPAKGARLTLSYTAVTGSAAAVKLDCEPLGGGHPAGAAACAVLKTAGGDPDRIPTGHNACFLIYAPVVAEVTGTWHGRPLRWQHRYGNTCEMRRATGPLFVF